jgi:cytochrome c peroxidase
MKIVTLLVFCCFVMLGCKQKVSQKLIASKEELGEAIFFDPILSRDSSISCASCHKPEFAFADNVALSKGIHGRIGERNTPSVMNQNNRNLYFWDGRSETLEDQAFGPMENHNEMDLPISIIIQRLKKSERYKNAFFTVFGKAPAKSSLADAIASYENTLETSDSPFDSYMKGKDTIAFSESSKRGLNIFNNKGKCFDCHFGVDFTGNDQFKNIGLYNEKNLNDKGRYNVSGDARDVGRFKTPGLRNIAQTAPYMHNGMFKSLREVIDYYNDPDKVINNSLNRDSLLKKPLGLTEIEKKDLENFLVSLSDKRFQKTD